MIRKATAADIDAVEKIYDKIHGNEKSGLSTIGWVEGIYPIRQTAENAHKNRWLYVCEKDKTVVASAIINHVQVPEYCMGNWQFDADDSEVLVLHTLTVDPEEAGAGIGKQFVALGGYEAYVNALRVREFCEFNNNVAVYQAGIMGVVQFNPAQQFILQVVNNRSGSDSDLYIYGRPDGIEAAKIPLLATVNWNGFFLDDALHFRYSASMGQLAKGKNIYYLTCKE